MKKSIFYVSLLGILGVSSVFAQRKAVPRPNTPNINQIADQDVLLRQGVAFLLAKDYDNAYKVFLQLHEANNPRGTVTLADLYTEKTWSGYDVQKGIALYQSLLRPNVRRRFRIHAMKALRRIYYDAKDYKNAFPYAKMLARTGNIFHIMQLAVYYEEGLGVEKSPEQVSALLQQVLPASESKLRPRQNRLAYKMLSEANIGLDPKLAMQAAQKAYRYGDIRSLFVMGLLYRMSPAFVQEKEKAIDCYRKVLKSASVENYPKAYLRLGILYQNPDHPFSDFTKARQYLQKALDGKEQEALYYLALMTENGWGEPKDEAQAAKAYQNCMQIAPQVQGCPLNLAVMYRDGRGVRKNTEKFLSLMDDLSQRGNAKAHAYLGFYYDDAYGAKRQTKKIYYHFSQSCRLGFAYACKVMKGLQQ